MSNRHRTARKAKHERLRHPSSAPVADLPPLLIPTPNRESTMTDLDLIREFNANAALRSEFGDVKTYCAYRRAEIAGFVKTNRPVNTPPPADLDPERAEFRAIWDGPLKDFQQFCPGGFEGSFNLIQAGKAQRAAKNAFPCTSP